MEKMLNMSEAIHVLRSIGYPEPNSIKGDDKAFFNCYIDGAESEKKDKTVLIKADRVIFGWSLSSWNGDKATLSSVLHDKGISNYSKYIKDTCINGKMYEYRPQKQNHNTDNEAKKDKKLIAIRMNVKPIDDDISKEPLINYMLSRKILQGYYSSIAELKNNMRYIYKWSFGGKIREHVLCTKWTTLQGDFVRYELRTIEGEKSRDRTKDKDGLLGYFILGNPAEATCIWIVEGVEDALTLKTYIQVKYSEHANNMCILAIGSKANYKKIKIDHSKKYIFILDADVPKASEAIPAGTNILSKHVYFNNEIYKDINSAVVHIGDNTNKCIEDIELR